MYLSRARQYRPSLPVPLPIFPNFIHCKGIYSSFATRLNISSINRAAKRREHATGWQKTCVPILVFATISAIGGKSHNLSGDWVVSGAKQGSCCDGSQGILSQIPPDRKPNTRLLAKAEAGKLLRFPKQAFPHRSENSAPIGKSGAERKAVSLNSGFLYPKARESPPRVAGPSQAESPESGAAGRESQ